MKYNKIIFLDIDGVINIPPYEFFNKDCCKRVQRMCDVTGAKIVVSSSWRTDTVYTTQKVFPDYLQPYIVGVTIRGYHELKDKSELEIERGIEIRHWVDRNMKYSWKDNPEYDKQYSKYDVNGEWIHMESAELGKDYTYVILDDDADMLLEQKDWFIQCDGEKGFTEENLTEGIKILNQIK